MRVFGQYALLLAFAASGYATLACLVGGLGRRNRLAQVGTIAAVVSVAALTVTVAILSTALLSKDFEFILGNILSRRYGSARLVRCCCGHGFKGCSPCSSAS
jgi:hypothetical protein